MSNDKKKNTSDYCYSRSNEEPENENKEKTPILFVDVNLQSGQTERLVIYEGDDTLKIVHEFSQEYSNFKIDLDQETEERLHVKIEEQISKVLTKIDEEDIILEEGEI